jgi:carbonic anhydrase/acetyltransferase-like protein (isoleucine patch superfamily)
MILSYKGISPEFDESVFIAPSADVIGRVKLGKNCSVWFNATVRADVGDVIIGDNTNIQDNCCLHQSEDMPLVIGENVTVGHNATLHSCTIGNNSLIGMGATVLDGAAIGKGSIVAAGSLVLERKSYPDYSLIGGVPAKILRELPEDTFEKLFHHAQTYVDLAGNYKQELKS